MISKDDLLKIRESLPKQYVSIIRERLDNQYSKTYIGQVLRCEGGKFNDDIVEAAIALAEETRTRNLALKQRINTLAS